MSDEPDGTITGPKENIPDNENPEDPAGMWDAFMANLSAYGFRELADSIDECDIDRKCRSDVINAIVRTFITVYLPRLRAYRKKSKSLLDNDNTK